jgi:hypothetical protein
MTKTLTLSRNLVLFCLLVRATLTTPLQPLKSNEVEKERLPALLLVQCIGPPTTAARVSVFEGGCQEKQEITSLAKRDEVCWHDGKEGSELWQRSFEF